VGEGVGDGVGVGGIIAWNVAVIVFIAFTLTMAEVPEFESTPLQLANELPLAGISVRVTMVADEYDHVAMEDVE
jgi:hypothetical protein